MSWYAKTALGKETNYHNAYNPALLCPLLRAEGRQQLGLDSANLPFQGVDIWHNYEASWLNSKGKPQVAIVQLHFPAESTYLIESKSLKLYFNSLNFKRFNNEEEVITLLERDLSVAAAAPVKAILIPVNKVNQTQLLQGICLDELDIEVTDFRLNPQLLKNNTDAAMITETVYSHLLRSNCPVTNQPDWGSVSITYTGQTIHHESLLRYLISFREHNDFHEQCVERIFCDISRLCQPEKLTIQAYYTRRGGLDINPFRSNVDLAAQFQRLVRQ